MAGMDDIDIFEAEAPRRSPDAYRRDGSLKSQTGFLGPIINKHSGKPMTELSIGVEIGGREVEIPSMVPTLTEEERILLQNLRIGVDPVPKSIAIKAKRHAMERIKAGLSPFLPAEPQKMNLGGSVGQMNRRQQPKNVSRLTPAQLANIGAAFADPLGMVDITGEYPEFPTAGVSTAEMVMEGPRSPSLMENLREGDFGAAALQGVGVIPIVGGAARAIRGMLKGTDRLEKAKKAGFDTDTVYYHATEAFDDDAPHPSYVDFSQLKPSKRGKLGPGVYMADEPSYAERYIRRQKGETSPFGPKGDFGTGARVLPLFVRGKLATKKEYFDALDKAPDLLKEEFDAIDAAFEGKFGATYDAQQEKNRLQKQKVQDILAEDGFSGFKVNEEVVVFDPKNIRSVNAQFEDLDSPKLLKAEGGAIDINDIDIFGSVQNFVGGGGVGKKLLSGKSDDAEKRREQAKEQGFDLDNVMYHASKQDIDEFVPGYDDGLVFLTPSKEFANNWLGKGKFQERQDGTGAIEGVRAEIKQFNKEANEILESLPEDQRTQYYLEVLSPKSQQLLREEGEADSAIYPVVTRTKKPFVPSKDVDVLEELYGKEYLEAPFGSGFATFKDAMRDGNYLLYENKQVVDFLKSKGYDSMFLKESSGADQPFTTLAVFEPSDIRSVNAKFDPKKKGSPKILASAPFAAGLGAMGAMQEARAATLQAEGAPLEVALDAATAAGAPIVGGLAGLAEFTQGLPRRIAGDFTGEESAARIKALREGVSGALNYDPTSKIGREMSRKAQKGIVGLLQPIVESARPQVEGLLDYISADEQRYTPLGALYRGGKYAYEDLFGEAEREAAKSAMDLAL